MRFWSLDYAKHRNLIKRSVAFSMIGSLLVVAANPWITKSAKDWIGDYQILAVAAILLGFCAAYILRSKWRKHVAGRALLYMAGTFAVFTIWITCSTFFGRDWVPMIWSELRIVVYGSVFMSCFNMLWTLLEIQSGYTPREPDRLQGEVFQRDSQ